MSPDDGSFRIETGVGFAIPNKRDTGAMEEGEGSESRENRMEGTARGERTAEKRGLG